jgi:hypothetical protein
MSNDIRGDIKSAVQQHGLQIVLAAVADAAKEIGDEKMIEAEGKKNRAGASEAKKWIKNSELINTLILRLHVQ